MSRDPPPPHGRPSAHRPPAVPIDRLSAADMMALVSAASAGPMQVGAVVVLGAGPGSGPAVAEALIADRVRAVPRLRQRLLRTPPGCGRPIWVDDAGFDIRRHLRRISCPPPGDEQALLDLAARVITARLPRSRPLWAAAIVTGLAADGKLALIVTFHHVLADGIILAAVTGALHTLLLRRGEDVDALVVSVPVSARAAATTSQLGNQTGIMRRMKPRFPRHRAAGLGRDRLRRVGHGDRGPGRPEGTRPAGIRRSHAAEMSRRPNGAFVHVR